LWFILFKVKTQEFLWQVLLYVYGKNKGKTLSTDTLPLYSKQLKAALLFSGLPGPQKNALFLDEHEKISIAQPL